MTPLHQPTTPNHLYITTLRSWPQAIDLNVSHCKYEFLLDTSSLLCLGDFAGDFPGRLPGTTSRDQGPVKRCCQLRGRLVCQTSGGIGWDLCIVNPIYSWYKFCTYIIQYRIILSCILCVNKFLIETTKYWYTLWNTDIQYTLHIEISRFPHLTRLLLSKSSLEILWHDQPWPSTHEPRTALKKNTSNVFRCSQFV